MKNKESFLPGVESGSTEAFVADSLTKLTPFQAQTLKLVAEGQLTVKQARENLVLGLDDKGKEACFDAWYVIDFYLNGVLTDEEFKSKYDEIVSRYSGE